ncbi:MAG: phosphoribosylglycinamide formyltransferase [Proteobacteria bacterium]|nr:phosphoribosylglycinamide formyltransferase [Pseudomonadota bacterium]
MKHARVGVLISGRGSNMAALLEAARDPGYPAEVVLVLSNNPAAPGLGTARAAGIEARAIDHRGRDKASHEADLTAALQGAGVEVVALAGYMRLLSPAFIEAWRGRILNIHPSLLPLYPGLHTHRRALEAGDAEAGCSVHLVTEGVDEGPVLAQARVPVLPGDTEESLAARVLEAEHALYPAALAEFVSRRSDRL